MKTFKVKTADEEIEVKGFDYGKFFVHRSIRDETLWTVTDKKSQMAVCTFLSYLSAARFIAKDVSLPEIAERARNKDFQDRIAFVPGWLREFKYEKKDFQSFNYYFSEQVGSC